MSEAAAGFSEEWLKLREDVDHRSRNRDVSDALAARLALRDSVRVIDLGAGTGSNLRATAGLLPSKQDWTLVDKDVSLLATARMRLRAWAQSCSEDGAELTLLKSGRSIRVSFAEADLTRDLEMILTRPADLITSSAFFDLTSAEFIRTLVKGVSEARAAFYAALTYNGVQRWQPHRPLDNQMTAAFHRHQLRDKGFGPAAGPSAAAHIADYFKVSGYAVVEGDSPWQLGRNDRMLMDELVRGHAFAVAETGLVATKSIEDWVKVQRTAAVVGHVDIFAAPTS